MRREPPRTRRGTSVGGVNPTFISDSLCDGGEDGPWVFEVPPDLVQRLASLAPHQLAEASVKWAATDEFSPRYSKWPTEAVQQVLSNLTALCKQAVGDGKAVLMWMCL